MMSRVTYPRGLAVLLLLTVLTGACRKQISEDVGQAVRSNLDKAETMVSLSQYEDAARYGFEALAAAEASSDKHAKQLACETHTVLSRIYLQALQDSLAWEHACTAEHQALQIPNDSLLATALFLKGQVCSYAGISIETARDDEGLEYTLRALAIAEKAGYPNIATSARYQMSELYVNKNRWNVRLDPALYEKAGFWLDQAEQSDPSVPSVRSMRYHFRYLRQGNRTAESIDYCNKMLELAAPDNHLLRQQMQDHLTNMYLQLGQIDKAMASHQAFSYEMQQYIRQKEDKTMQELRVLYEVEMKDRQIKMRTALVALLIALLTLTLGIIFLTVRLNRKITRQNKKIKAVSRSREMLFAVIAKDLNDPDMDSIQDQKVLDFFRKWPTMDEKDIIRESAELTAGEDALDPAVTRYVTDLMLSRKRALSEIGLSAREMEIISLSKEGLTDKQIAERLFLSPRTVSNHKAHIYAKLDVKSNTEMLSKIQELGL